MVSGLNFSFILNPKTTIANKMNADIVRGSDLYNSPDSLVQSYSAVSHLLSDIINSPGFAVCGQCVEHSPQ